MRGYDGRAKGKCAYHKNVIVTGYGGMMRGNRIKRGYEGGIQGGLENYKRLMCNGMGARSRIRAKQGVPGSGYVGTYPREYY
jgi:hypothetical protein